MEMTINGYGCWLACWSSLLSPSQG